jgi:hypothetical protein
MPGDRGQFQRSICDRNVEQHFWEMACHVWSGNLLYLGYYLHYRGIHILQRVYTFLLYLDLMVWRQVLLATYGR